LAHALDENPSEEVLTNNTYLEKRTNQFSLPEETFVDSVSGIVDESKQNELQNQWTLFKDTQIQSYFDQIKQINEKIKSLDEAC
jgi:hypothetical protein